MPQLQITMVLLQIPTKNTITKNLFLAYIHVKIRHFFQNVEILVDQLIMQQLTNLMLVLLLMRVRVVLLAQQMLIVNFGCFILRPTLSQLRLISAS